MAHIMKINLSRNSVPLAMALLAITLPALTAAQSRDAHASGRGGGGWHGGGGRHGGGGWHGDGLGWWGLGLGLGLGWEAAYLANPYPYPYYPYPVYTYPYSPAVIGEPSSPPMPFQPMAPVNPPNYAATSNWYFCESARGYYPYVTQCPEAWRLVSATPPSAVR
jgi:hypothetical protein